MKKRKNSGIVAIFVGIIMICLIACGAKELAQSQDEAKESTSGLGEVTITWWAFPLFDNSMSGEYEQQVIAAFEEKNPGIQVELELIDYSTGPEKIENALQNGTVCDVLLDAPGRIIAYAKEGYLVSLEALFTEELIADIQNETLVQSCMADGVPYMYPLSASPFYMAFNKQMLEDAGVAELVREGWTTEDFIQVLTALRDHEYVPGSVFCYDQGGDQGTRAFIANLYNAQVTDAALTEYLINSENGIQALQLVQDMVADGLLLNGNHNTGTKAIENFVNGRASFTLLWGLSQQSTNQEQLDQSGIETVEVPYPSADGTPELEYLVNGLCVFDHADAARAEAAGKFIQFLCEDAEWGPKSVLQSGCLPVRTSSGSLYEEERMSRIAQWSEYYSTYYNTIDGFAKMRPYWYQMLQKLLINEMDAQEAADYFVTHADATICGE